MNVMHYEIPLPADYDMDIIRRRVATKGGATDDFPGLGLKAYVIRERGIAGSPVNQYAPFYLWASIDGMNRFMWGEGFRGLCDSFGRPSVAQWTGIAFEQGQAQATTPRAATRSRRLVPPDADPGDFIESALEELRKQAHAPAVHSTALAVDTRRWELVQFTLWEFESQAPTETHYQVLHVSMPHLGEITSGRHW